MKLKYLPLLMLLPFCFVSCGGDDNETTGKLNLTFKAVYGDQPLVLNSELYEHLDGKMMSFSKLNLFISDLSLTGENNTTIELSKISFIDFLTSNTTAVGAESGIVLSTEVEEENYFTMNFGLGVASDMNAMEPGSFSNDHPLAQSGQYWSVWNSFIFSKTEGRYDADGDGTPELGFAYHLGGDPLYREVEHNAALASGINIIGGKTTNLTVEIDFKALFLSTGAGGIDIPTTPGFHNPNDPSQAALGEHMADNYESAVRIY